MSGATPDGLDRRCATAAAVAREAGEVARRWFRNFEALETRQKAPRDLVTAADMAVDRLVRTGLSRSFPHDALLSEETAGDGAVGGDLWVVDPIDGTGNFARGLSHFAIAIAFRRDARTEIGVVYDVMADEMFVARRGGGAACNGVPIRANAAAQPDGALIEAGYSARSPFGDYLARVAALDAAGFEFCQRGSAALGLAHVACGRLDGYWESHLFAWDVLAGLLLVEEAGGWAGAFDGGAGLTAGGAALACASPLAGPLRRIVGWRDPA